MAQKHFYALIKINSCLYHLLQNGHHIFLVTFLKHFSIYFDVAFNIILVYIHKAIITAVYVQKALYRFIRVSSTPENPGNLLELFFP